MNITLFILYVSVVECDMKDYLPFFVWSLNSTTFSEVIFPFFASFLGFLFRFLTSSFLQYSFCGNSRNGCLAIFMKTVYNHPVKRCGGVSTPTGQNQLNELNAAGQSGSCAEKALGRLKATRP